MKEKPTYVGTTESKHVKLVVLMFSAKDAALVCGMSERAWRKREELGLIPQPIRIGKSVYWRAEELRDWINQGCPPRNVWRWKPSDGANASPLKTIVIGDTPLERSRNGLPTAQVPQRA